MFFDNIVLGLQVAASPTNLLFCFLGVFLGTLVGILPGLGPVATIAVLLPLTYGLEPATALILLAGIYYGAQYGGSTTAILVNIPGETGSVVTTLDGYQMARQGRAGQALYVAAVGSFIAGTVATLFIAALSPTLARFGLMFGPAEYFSLMILGLVASFVLSRGSYVKAMMMIFLGLFISMVGTDSTTGEVRYTFGFTELYEGIDFVVIALGLFGISEVLMSMKEGDRDGSSAPIAKLGIPRELRRRTYMAISRGTGIGSLLGLIPGGGAILGAFASYAVEKKLSSRPEEFGRGAIEGVAGPEAANNAGAQTSFIPLLTLGLPSNAVTALMLGALIVHNVRPGPQVISTNPDLFWGFIVSMWIGNLLLLVLNLPLIGIWTRLLSIKYRLIYPCIVLVCSIGVYIATNSAFSVYLLAISSVVGYMLRRAGYELTPLLLAFVLGPMLEENLRRGLLITGGDFVGFVSTPISLGLLALTAVLLLLIVLPKFARSRSEIFSDSD